MVPNASAFGTPNRGLLDIATPSRGLLDDATPAGGRLESARKALMSLTPVERTQLARECKDDGVYGQADGYGKAMADAFSSNQMIKDLRGAIPLLTDVGDIEKLMVFLHMCGTQARGADYRPAMVAALTRTSCIAIHARCTPYVSSSDNVSAGDWSAVVTTVMADTHDRHYLQRARAAWPNMRIEEAESTSAYATRSDRKYKAYEYVSKLVGKHRGDDQHSFVEHWVNGLTESFRNHVALKVSEDTATMAEARRAAQRLESTAKASHQSDETSKLKRKLEQLEEKLERQAKSRRTDSPEHLIAMLGPHLRKREETFAGSLRYNRPRSPAPRPPSYPPPRHVAQADTRRNPQRKQYCREFTRHGKCTRGESCKYDHSCPKDACWICGQNGHMSYQCELAPACSACDQKGHSMKFCPSRKNA